MSLRVTASGLLSWQFVTHLIFNRLFLWDIHGSFRDLKESLVLPGKIVTYYSKCYCRVIDQDTLSQHC